MTTATVRVEMTVEVNIEDWAENYGVEPTEVAVRKDVRDWAQYAVREASTSNVPLKVVRFTR